MDFINRQQIGDEAEEAASQFLQAKGYKLLETKYRCFCGEIDLIMQDQEDIVFVEVRLRQHTEFGSAAESVNSKKMNKLVKTATFYLQAKRWLHKRNSRFDVIAIHPMAGKMQLDWIKNAFTVDKYW